MIQRDFALSYLFFEGASPKSKGKVWRIKFVGRRKKKRWNGRKKTGTKFACVFFLIWKLSPSIYSDRRKELFSRSLSSFSGFPQRGLLAPLLQSRSLWKLDVNAFSPPFSFRHFSDNEERKTKRKLLHFWSFYWYNNPITESLRATRSFNDDSFQLETIKSLC